MVVSACVETKKFYYKGLCYEEVLLKQLRLNIFSQIILFLALKIIITNNFIFSIEMSLPILNKMSAHESNCENVCSSSRN